MQKNIPPRWSIDSSMYDAYELSGLTTSDTHWHSHFLLNIITGGELVQEINGKSFTLRRGDAIIISPVDFHRNIVEENARVSVLAVKFSDKLFYDSLSDICSFDDFPIVSTLDTKALQSAEQMFELLLNEQKNSAALGSDKFSKSLIEQMVILILRACGREQAAEKKSKVHRALGFIHCNFRRNIKAADAAAFVGYSPNYFSAEFKKETGVEFQKYLRDLRLDFAMNLLKFSKLSVTEVCFESGFNTLPHFSQSFKKRFGKSPDKIKEEHK